MIVSFAQNSEDVVLRRSLERRSAGFYIDVGAAHPSHHSVTKLLYDRGWSGINIEPHPEFFRLLSRERPRDINLNLGLSNEDGTLTFYEHPTLPGSSTFELSLAKHYHVAGIETTQHEVEVTTLAHVCEEYAAETIDFVKIDVEGHERKVLEGAGFERFRPRVVIVEAVDPQTAKLNTDWEHMLISSSYEFTLFDGLNRFYVREGDHALAEKVRVPANVFDDFVPADHVKRIAALQARLDCAEQWVASEKHALAETRTRLAEARTALRDAREEIVALRSALVDDVAREGAEQGVKPSPP